MKDVIAIVIWRGVTLSHISRGVTPSHIPPRHPLQSTLQIYLSACGPTANMLQLLHNVCDMTKTMGWLYFCPAKMLSNAPLGTFHITNGLTRSCSTLVIVIQSLIAEERHFVYCHILSYTYTVTYCYKLLHTVTYCHTLSYTVIHCHKLPYIAMYCHILSYTDIYCHMLPYTAIYCHILPYTVIYCLILSYVLSYAP